MSTVLRPELTCWLLAGFRGLLLFLVIVGESAVSASAQSASATLTGTVVDATGAVVASTKIVVKNAETGVSHNVTSGADGSFIVTPLRPGQYVLHASVAGFAPTEMRDLVLHVGDRASVRVVLDVAGVGESTTVFAEAQRVSTSPSAGTVIDRRFVENLPLNGRSLQSLLDLTPGVVLATGGSGFSVNGQRTNANYLTVDGVGANVGVVAGVFVVPGQSGSGQTPALTALGTTSSLVSVDALQEFRIETSGYAPEFGRSPGGQVSLVTRSGTNEFHGSVFDFFRHDALDATDWFVNNQGLDKAKLRQHNFGGVFGGPLFRNRSFFFGSYEGLRLDQPQARTVNVPTIAAREAAAPVLRPYLDALPRPNGRSIGVGLAEFAASWSDASRTDSTGIRMDHNAGRGITVFGRFSYAPSYQDLRLNALTTVHTSHSTNTTLTSGSTWTITPRLIHDVRINYTSTHAPYTMEVDDFGGAIPPPASVFQAGRTPGNTAYTFLVGSSQGVWSWGTGTDYKQRQINLVDSVTWMLSSHEIKAGLDFRRTSPLLGGNKAGTQQLTVALAQLPLGVAQSYLASTYGSDRISPIFDNVSLYVQDAWRVASRLTLTYGIRWEMVPPPKAEDSESPATFENFNNAAGESVRFAPSGTRLWNTRYGNVAPRVGASYVLSDKSASQLVLRGGFGMFYDLGYGLVANGFASYPLRALRSVPNQALPLSASAAAEPVLGADFPSTLFIPKRDIDLPLTYQWNVSIAQSLGGRQNLTVGYVGARGRDLLQVGRYAVPLASFGGATSTVALTGNAGYSEYDSLQVQYQRRMYQRFQALISYTFGHSQDTASGDATVFAPLERVSLDQSYGDSDFDVRNTLTAALTYQPPSLAGTRLLRSITNGWGIDLMLRARSGTPINVRTNVPFPPETEAVRVNTVPGEPFWLDDVDAPGRRRLNPRAFSIPPASTQGNLPRGAIRGFPVRQVDLAVRREIRLSGQIRLQVRAEMFNLLNTPNFSYFPVNLTVDATGAPVLSSNGEAIDTLNATLGGLNAMYQIGGPRSSQIGLKLLF